MNGVFVCAASSLISLCLFPHIVALKSVFTSSCSHDVEAVEFLVAAGNLMCHTDGRNMLSFAVVGCFMCTYFTRFWIIFWLILHFLLY